MKRYLMLSLALILAFSALPAFAATAGDVDVTQYSYAVQPIFKNYATALYVKTDNPDPDSFLLADKDSAYVTEGEASWANRDGLYADVVYENPANYRVKGGYIFLPKSGTSDGGEFVLQQRKLTKTYDSYYHGYVASVSYEDTGVVVQCPKLVNTLDGAIAEYANSSMDFFDKLDAIQKGLESDAIYPRSLLNTDAPNEKIPYPLLALAYYQDLEINVHLESMYARHPGGLLITQAYPFVLDSSSFPSLLSAAARAFDPNCTVRTTYYHYRREIVHDGTSKFYGGAGVGSGDPLYSSRVTANYTFDGTADDLFGASALSSLRTRLLAYEDYVREDTASSLDLIQGNTFKETIRNVGGAWARIGMESFLGGDSVTFVYFYPDRSSIYQLTNTWVDGRYVNSRGELTLGETFANHPTAAIVERQKTCVYNGNTYTRDVLYRYNSSSQTWKGTWYPWYTKDLSSPPSFTLTKSEVEAMGVDANTFTTPTSGLIYDGKSAPGTAFNGATLTYLANNGEPVSPSTKQIQPVSIDVPVKLWENPTFTPPTSPEGLKFKAWRINGVEYAGGETVIPEGDMVAEAVWQNFFAQMTEDGTGVQVYVGCASDFEGKVYCVFTNYYNQFVSLASAPLGGGGNEITFPKPPYSAYWAKLIVVDSTLVPQGIEYVKV